MESPHERRRVLVFLGGAAALAACSDSRRSTERVQVGEAQPLAPLREVTREQPLADVWQRAQQLGKPLLVILVPKELEAQPTAKLFGVLLNHATDSTLATLALAELVCASREEVQALHGVECEAGDHFTLIESLGGVAKATAFGGKLSTIVPPREFLRSSARAANSDGDRHMCDLANQLAAAICGALKADAVMLERRVVAARARLSPQLVDSFATLDASALTLVQLVEHAALAHAAAADEYKREVLLARLAEGARQRWVKAAPPGSRWAEVNGCASVHVDGFTEDEQQVMFLCGMGYVSALSDRFLWFYGPPRANAEN